MSKNNRVKVRATTHRGRGSQSGVYPTEHGDRNFDVSKSKHIDPVLPLF